MAIDTGIGISLSLVTKTRQAPLGQTVLKPAGIDGNGESTYIYVSYIATAVPVDLVIGNVVGHATGALGYADVRRALAAPNADPGTVVGVTQNAWTWLTHYPLGAGAADELFGFVQRTGVGKVLQLAGATVDEGLIASLTAGSATGVAAVTDASFATAGTTGVGTLDCKIHCKG